MENREEAVMFALCFVTVTFQSRKQNFVLCKKLWPLQMLTIAFFFTNMKVIFFKKKKH